MALVKTNLPVSGTLVPYLDDTYPTHKSEYGYGGLHSVSNLTERNNIPDERREIGMVVYVSSETAAPYFVLKDGISNSNWINLFELVNNQDYTKCIISTVEPTTLTYPRVLWINPSTTEIYYRSSLDLDWAQIKIKATGIDGGDFS